MRSDWSDAGCALRRAAPLGPARPLLLHGTAVATMHPNGSHTAQVVCGRALSDGGLCMARPACSASWPGVKAGTCAGECMHGHASLPTCNRCCKGLHWNACLTNRSATRDVPSTYEDKAHVHALELTTEFHAQHLAPLTTGAVQRRARGSSCGGALPPAAFVCY